MTSQLPSKVRYMNNAEEIQARVNKFFKNIPEIKPLVEVRSTSQVLSEKLRNLSMQDHGL